MNNKKWKDKKTVFEDLDFICPAFAKKVRNVGKRMCRLISEILPKNIKFCSSCNCPSPWRIKKENIVNK